MAEDSRINQPDAPRADTGGAGPADRRRARIGGPFFVEMGALERLDSMETSSRREYTRVIGESL